MKHRNSTVQVDAPGEQDEILATLCQPFSESLHYEWTDSQVDVCVEVDEADEGDDEGDDEPRQVHVVEDVVGVHPQVRRLFKRRDREL